MRGQYSLLLAEIVDTGSQDGPLGRDDVAEPLDVGLAEGSFPREGLGPDGPRPMVSAA